MKTPRQKVIKPKGLASRTFTVDGKELFKALGKGALHFTQAKWEDVAGDVLDTISAVGIGTEPAALAHVLLRRAAVRALFKLVSETVESIVLGVRPYEDMVSDSVVETIASYEITIDQDFFDRPLELPLVAGLQELLRKWLQLLAVPEHIATTVVERLPSYFLYSLNEEWRTGRKTYQPILDSLDTPFAKASDREWAWRAYNSLLRLKVNEGSFDEPFSLQQIYVPLRAYYEDDTKVQVQMGALSRRAKIRTVVDLQTELLDWLKVGRRDDAVRVLSGGPGSGKSSFAKMFAAHLAEQEHLKVLFIPLHQLDPSKDLVEEVGHFVETVLPYNPLAVDSNEPKLVLIFDGLDELANQGKAANEVARQFAVEVDRTVSRRNTQALRLQVIISGRELIVQGNELEFRKPHQILTLLPYLIEKESLGDEKLVRDPHTIREVDQRHRWWQQYGRLTGQPYQGLPEHLDRKDLQEITAQPLLNYLVALSYTRGHLDFSQDINLNQVYEDLVSAVHDRAYEQRRLHVSIRNMTLPDFIRILEEIGLAAWHGNGRTTTVGEIAEHCKTSGLGEMLAKFEEGAKAGVTRLLAAFFFRQHERNAQGEQTFEFTHKSFGEYLAARRIVRAMSRITDEREARTGNPDRGWGERDALLHWARTTSANPLTSYLIPFITNELALRELSYVRKMQVCFANLFSLVLNQEMPIEQLGYPQFSAQLYLSGNCEEALLVCMALCAKITKRISPVKFSGSIAFNIWYNRVHGQRFSIDTSLVANHLYYLDFSKMNLSFLNLFGANISHSIFRGANLFFLNLAYSDVYNADFTEATAYNINLTHSKMSGCTFEDTSMSAAILDETSFRNCNLTNCVLYSRKDIIKANFVKSNSNDFYFLEEHQDA
jgi:hypothetical protein